MLVCKSKLEGEVRGLQLVGCHVMSIMSILSCSGNTLVLGPIRPLPLFPEQEIGALAVAWEETFGKLKTKEP